MMDVTPDQERDGTEAEAGTEARSAVLELVVPWAVGVVLLRPVLRLEIRVWAILMGSTMNDETLSGWAKMGRPLVLTIPNPHGRPPFDGSSWVGQFSA